MQLQAYERFPMSKDDQRIAQIRAHMSIYTPRAKLHYRMAYFLFATFNCGVTSVETAMYQQSAFRNVKGKRHTFTTAYTVHATCHIYIVPGSDSLTRVEKKHEDALGNL